MSIKVSKVSSIARSSILTAWLFLTLLCSCEVSKKLPPRKIKLPAVLNEASGLAIQSDLSTALLHNDSGDGPNLYLVALPTGEVLKTDDLKVPASDWEDICTDPQGRVYLGDVGNNLGNRQAQTIYRFNPTTGMTEAIHYTYPKQNGLGRRAAGNYDCEAMVYLKNELHLFTKALPGRRKSYWAYHFKLPADPGNYVAELVDSLYLPRRVITGAALDAQRNELLLSSYNYKRVLGFFPAVASSVIQFKAFTGTNFFRGEIKRRNVSWAIPIQYEAIDFYDGRYYYLATEKVPSRKQAFMKRKRRF